jgi:excisionase family DNA binding protein
MTLDPELSLVTISEAMATLACSRATIYRLIDDGQLVRVKPRAGMARITGRSLIAYVKRLDAEALGTAPTANPKATAPNTLASKAADVLARLGLGGPAR